MSELETAKKAATSTTHLLHYSDKKWQWCIETATYCNVQTLAQCSLRHVFLNISDKRIPGFCFLPRQKVMSVPWCYSSIRSWKLTSFLHYMVRKTSNLVLFCTSLLLIITLFCCFLFSDPLQSLTQNGSSLHRPPADSSVAAALCFTAAVCFLIALLVSYRKCQTSLVRIHNVSAENHSEL